MVEYYKYAPEVEYPNLFFEISNSLKHHLSENNIEHTKTELIFLREKILKNLSITNITQQNYNQDEHFTSKLGVVLYEINNFYKTNLKI